MNAYGTSLAGIPSNREGFGTLIPDVASVSHDDPAELATFLAEHGDRVAAFIGEPVIGAGGILHPPAGYWAEVQALCRSHDVLLVADEVITGFGRLGRWFGSERLGIEPDLITCAKAITSGYLPLGAVIAAPRVQEPFWSQPGSLFRHGFTYSGHPTACAVGLANIDVMERERLVERVAELEPVLAGMFEPLRSAPLVSRGARRPGTARRRGVRRRRPGGRSGPRRPHRACLPRPRRAHARPGRARAADLPALRDHRGRAAHASRPASPPRSTPWPPHHPRPPPSRARRSAVAARARSTPGAPGVGATASSRRSVSMTARGSASGRSSPAAIRSASSQFCGQQPGDRRRQPLAADPELGVAAHGAGQRRRGGARSPAAAGAGPRRPRWAHPGRSPT